MQVVHNLKSTQLFDFLLNIAPVCPVFIWGAPGIGKSSLVELFALEVGLDCVSLLGSQLAPEDIIGVPQIVGGKSRFCPPTLIARDEPFCLFLDELNACSQEVQKAFYSLINDQRIGEYELPKGSIVIGAGNRTEDSAIVKPLSSALVNRMIHVNLQVHYRSWLDWAIQHTLHPLVTDYIQIRPEHLFSKPPQYEQPFSTPRSWHMLSNCLKSYTEDDLNTEVVKQLASGLLTPAHARQFIGYYKHQHYGFSIDEIIYGQRSWPKKLEERDVLHFLVHSFRLYLIKSLNYSFQPSEQDNLVENAKKLIIQLAHISPETAQIIFTEPETHTYDDNNYDMYQLPAWFSIEVLRSLPNLRTV